MQGFLLPGQSCEDSGTGKHNVFNDICDLAEVPSLSMTRLEEIGGHLKR